MEILNPQQLARAEGYLALFLVRTQFWVNYLF